MARQLKLADRLIGVEAHLNLDAYDIRFRDRDRYVLVRVSGSAARNAFGVYRVGALTDLRRLIRDELRAAKCYPASRLADMALTMIAVRLLIWPTESVDVRRWWT